MAKKVVKKVAKKVVKKEIDRHELVNQIENKICVDASGIEWYKAIQKAMEPLRASTNTIMPRNCIYLDDSYVVLEFLPQRRTLICSQHSLTREDVRSQYNVPFPYLYFVICYSKHRNKVEFDDLFLVAKDKPIKSLEESVGVLKLPHAELGNVCMPDMKRNYNSLGEMCDQVVKSFWFSKFNHYFEPFVLNFGKGKKAKRISSWTAWAKLTTTDMLKVVLKYQRKMSDIVKGDSDFKDEIFEDTCERISDIVQARIENICHQIRKKLD